MKVVLDTNVIISGLLWKAHTRVLFDLIDEGRIQLCLTFQIIKEIERVLNYSHIKRQLNSIDLTVAEIIGYLLQVSHIYPDTEIDVDILDQSDKIFLAAAQVSNAQYLITGDKHLLTIESFQETKIIQPREFITLFNGNKI